MALSRPLLQHRHNLTLSGMLLWSVLLGVVRVGGHVSSSSTAGWPALEPDAKGVMWSAGNHRIVIQVDNLPPSANGTVRATVVWRRHDAMPELKNAFVVDARSHLLVPQCSRVSSNADNATFIFFASNGPSEYHLYYMPFTSCEFSGGGCPYGASAQYDAVPALVPTVRQQRACIDDPSWYSGVADAAMAVPASATLQSRSAFAAFPPIEQPATSAEMAVLLRTAPSDRPVLLFTEGREQPIRMQDKLPAAWAHRDLTTPPAFNGSAQPSERFTFQIALWAHKTAVTVEAVVFTALVLGGNGGVTIPLTAIHCMNTDGVDFWARPYTPESPVLVRVGMVVPLWISVALGETQAPGVYSGTATVKLGGGLPSQTVAVQLTVGGPSLGASHGDAEQWRGTRLAWLDSTLAASESTVPPPYQPLHQQSPGALAISMLDKIITLDPTGLIASANIGTRAAKAEDNFENAVEAAALVAPVVLRINGHTAEPTGNVAFGAVTPMSAEWTAGAATPGANVSVTGSLDATGYCDFAVSVTGTTDAGVSIELVLPANPANAVMMMGLGAPGGYIDELPLPLPPAGSTSQWLVLDFQREVTADAFGLFSSADGIHDPHGMLLQVAADAAGPWKPAGTFSGAPGQAGRQIFKFGDQMEVTSRFWRVIIVDVVESSMCLPKRFCQAWVAELQLRQASSQQWVDNSNNATVVVTSSGAEDPTLQPWKAADGVLNFSEFGHQGWDAGFAAVPGMAPPPPPDPATAWRWSWDGINGNNAAWVGSSSAGMRLFLKGSEPEWQAGVPYDSRATPDITDLNWNNGGNGEVRVYKNGTVSATTGTMALAKGASTTFHFSLMFTPVRPLNLSKHFSERYVQLGGPPPGSNYTILAEGGATVVNMHQGNGLNPWINYPYETVSLLKAAADACHADGMRFKLYNTMRELSNRCRELWAMRALNETYVTASPPGTEQTDGADWLQEHVQTDFLKAWSNPVENAYPGSGATPQPMQQWLNDDREQDAAIKVKALSRWNNYYVEGLRQLIADTGFDGIYLDEIAYDRVTMLRSKKVLGQGRLIDHHSDRGGFTPSPAANYLELYPFIDSLWYGEGFNYEKSSPGYWLVEITGVPHGLNADLLRYSGMEPAHFKGMLFANANRWQFGGGDADPFDPRALWALWKQFGIDRATMWGWWMDRERGVGTVPLAASNTSVKVTTFVRHGEATLVVLASFLTEDTTVTLNINWTALGLPANCSLVAPALPPMQTAKTFAATSPIPVTAGQGWIFLLSAV